MYSNSNNQTIRMDEEDVTDDFILLDKTSDWNANKQSMVDPK